MRYYIIAGERSGDLHGSNLVKAIRKHDPDAVFRGLGGDYLKKEGVELFTDYSEFAVMGFFAVLGNLVKISGYLKKCAADIIAFKADVMILIDYAGFNRQMARFGKKKKIKVFYYISPKVWAWNQRRAYALKSTVDRMFVILPFEKEFYKRFGWEVDYVGNPVLDAVKAHRPDDKFFSRNRLAASGSLVALLPGSRKQEVLRIIPMMAEIIRQFPDLSFGVATVNNLDPSLYTSLAALPNVRLIHEDTYDLLQHASAAIVTSGTATLETALFRVPEIVVYRTDALSYSVARKVVRVKFISLVNLIAGKEVVKELIQNEATPENVGAELKAILSDAAYRQRMLDDYDSIIKQLDTGSASENAARLMVKYLKC
jgi:lipid-A-disaccharide synthase